MKYTDLWKRSERSIGWTGRVDALDVPQGVLVPIAPASELGRAGYEVLAVPEEVVAEMAIKLLYARVDGPIVSAPDATRLIEKLRRIAGSES